VAWVAASVVVIGSPALANGMTSPGSWAMRCAVWRTRWRNRQPPARVGAQTRLGTRAHRQRQGVHAQGWCHAEDAIGEARRAEDRGAGRSKGRHDSSDRRQGDW